MNNSATMAGACERNGISFSREKAAHAFAGDHGAEQPTGSLAALMVGEERPQHKNMMLTVRMRTPTTSLRERARDRLLISVLHFRPHFHFTAPARARSFR